MSVRDNFIGKDYAQSLPEDTEEKQKNAVQTRGAQIFDTLKR